MLILLFLSPELLKTSAGYLVYLSGTNLQTDPVFYLEFFPQSEQTGPGGWGVSASPHQAGHNWICVPVFVVLTFHTERVCGQL